MQENLDRIQKCFVSLSEEEIWKRPNNSSNSIGNLILHLQGNITQYILSSLGGMKDERERDEEFSFDRKLAKSELFSRISETIGSSKEIIANQDEQSLLKTRSVQGFQLSGIGIIIHVVEHLSYHTGQIAFWAKAMKDTDLDFYAGQDLNQKNK